MIVLLLLALPAVRSQLPTPDTHVGFRNYQRHPFNAVQFVPAKPTKKGPILFPNDAPPPPPPPLIVTSRPLSESIARSELNPNNSLAAQSQQYQVSYRPEYLSRVQNYKPYAYALATPTPANNFESRILPYADNVGTGQGRDRFYNDYEIKHLIQSIHRRRPYEKQKRTLWEEPIQRRRMEQQRPSELKARKAMFGDEIKDKKIKVMHESLYSREADYNEEDLRHHQPSLLRSTAGRRPLAYEDDHTEFDVINNGRRNYRRSRRRKRMPRRRSSNRDYYVGRRNMKNSYRVKRRRDMKRKTIPSRRSQIKNNDETYNYDKKDHNTENLRDENHLKIRPSYRLESESDKDVIIKKKRADHSSEYLSDSSFIVLRSRTSQKLDVPSDNNEGNPESINWHSSENLSDRSYRILKRRPSHSPDESDNIERILHAPAARSKYKVSHSETLSKNTEQISKKLMRRPFRSILNHTTTKANHTIETTDTVILKKFTSRATKANVTENHDEHEDHKIIVQKRPTYNPNSDKESTETIAQQREVKLLYEVTGDGQRELKTKQKSVPTIKERFKSQTRPQAKISDAANYYTTRDSGHDNEKDLNQHGENYAFSYTVKDNKTGDDFSHSQQSTGSATNGEYRVRLPDGRMQIVSYTADEDGYKADVRYDDHVNNDNSIDDLSRENQYHTNDAYKNNDGQSVYDDHLDSHDLTDNIDYQQPRYKANKPHHYVNHYVNRPTTYDTHQDFNHADDFIDHTNDFVNKNDNAHKHAYAQKNDYVHKTDYTHASNFAHKNDFKDTTKLVVDDLKSLTDTNNDYLEHYNEKNRNANGQAPKPHDDDYFQFTDEIPFTKEELDYSNEFNHEYQPHRSKFSSFDNHKSVSTVRPSYEELKDLYVTNDNLRRQNLQLGSTVGPSYEEKKPNLYTNIRNIVGITPAPVTYSTPFASTPRAYLVSTIANLRHQVNLAHKPVLSRQYIDKINKYLTYK